MSTASDNTNTTSPSGSSTSQNAAATLSTSVEYTSILADPDNFNVKHPLHNSWTMWYDNPGKRTNMGNWSQNLKEIVTFDTVEDFWGVFNNVSKATQLTSGSSYHLFKKGIKPMWEDSHNQKGGKWVVQFPRNRLLGDVDEMWLNTMLACIGETFLFEDEVCGAVCSVRKGFYRLALWTRSSNRKDICEGIGHAFKATLGTEAQLEFQAHSDATKSGPYNKDRYVV